ncbi:MAG: hypothetical protein KatS3mg014_2446 [Actinomycetota bacterium]|nr:MAG: hypothetical protein KatS3mg014_2446 [Actinomycetota bacterium]
MALWDVLEALGASVTRVAVEALEPSDVESLVRHEARRLRILTEAL